MASETPAIETRLREMAKLQGLDLGMPYNAFTVWMVSKEHVVFCGRREDEPSAWILARSLTQLINLYILPANSRQHPIRVPDSDRIRNDLGMGKT